MPLATYDDARAEFARNAGHDNPDREWILTPFDTWERNPYYCGPKGRHPEDDYDENGIHYADERFGAPREDFHADVGGPVFDDEDLPF